MRRGFALIELTLVLALIAVLMALALPRFATWHDRWLVSRAGHEVAVFYQGARFGAISRATRVRLELSGDSLLAVYEGARDSVFHVWPGPAPDGVTLVATRPILRIGPTGLGFGAANTKILLSRGEASESLTTSRLGRLKRWR